MADCKQAPSGNRLRSRLWVERRSGNAKRPQKLKKTKTVGIHSVFVVTLQFMCLVRLGGNLSICWLILVQQ